MTTSVSVSREIPASAEQVWALVSDLPRMGEWSPENTGGSWVKGATGPAVGARFKGENSNGKKSWTTDARVMVCDPGRAFGFDVSAVGLPVSSWTYSVEPTADGTACTLTETWTDRRGAIARFFSKSASGVADRAAFTRESIETTLTNLATAAAERDAGA
jgi:hypothetical protein